MDRSSSSVLSQSVVVALLGIFIVIALVGMFSAGGTSDEIQWIGMSVKPLDGESAAALGIPADTGGVVVGEVDGIARKAGVRHGDVVVGINGEPVRDVFDFLKLTANANVPGLGARLDVVRGGDRLPILVSPHAGAPANGPIKGRAAAIQPGRPAARARVPGAEAATLPWPAGRPWLGVEAETLGAREGTEFGMPAGSVGVLIESVAPGSRAAWAGLARSDVVVSVNGRPVDRAADLWDMLSRLDGAGPVEFGVYRGGRLVFTGERTARVSLAAARRIAPPIPPNARRPHGDWGPCSNCHVIR